MSSSRIFKIYQSSHLILFLSILLNPLLDMCLLVSFPFQLATIVLQAGNAVFLNPFGHLAAGLPTLSVPKLDFQNTTYQSSNLFSIFILSNIFLWYPVTEQINCALGGRCLFITVAELLRHLNHKDHIGLRNCICYLKT